MYIVVCYVVCKKCGKQLIKEIKFDYYPYIHDIKKHTVICSNCKRRFNVANGANFRFCIKSKNKKYH